MEEGEEQDKDLPTGGMEPPLSSSSPPPRFGRRRGGVGGRRPRILDGIGFSSSSSSSVPPMDPPPPPPPPPITVTPALTREDSGVDGPTGEGWEKGTHLDLPRDQTTPSPDTSLVSNVSDTLLRNKDSILRRDSDLFFSDEANDDEDDLLAIIAGDEEDSGPLSKAVVGSNKDEDEDDGVEWKMEEEPVSDIEFSDGGDSISGGWDDPGDDGIQEEERGEEPREEATQRPQMVEHGTEEEIADKDSLLQNAQKDPSRVQELEEELLQFRAKHDDALRHYQEERRKSEEEITTLRMALADKDSLLQNAQKDPSRVQELEEELLQLRTEKETTHRRHEEELKNWKNRIDAQEGMRDDTAQRVTELHRREIEQLQSSFDETLQQLEETRTKEMDALRHQFEDQLRKVEEEKQLSLEEVQRRATQEKEALRQELQESVASLSHRHKCREEEQVALHTEERAKLKALYEERQSVREEVEGRARDINELTGRLRDTTEGVGDLLRMLTEAKNQQQTYREQELTRREEDLRVLCTTGREMAQRTAEDHTRMSSVLASLETITTDLRVFSQTQRSMTENALEQLRETQSAVHAAREAAVLDVEADRQTVNDLRSLWEKERIEVQAERKAVARERDSITATREAMLESERATSARLQSMEARVLQAQTRVQGGEDELQRLRLEIQTEKAEQVATRERLTAEKAAHDKEASIVQEHKEKLRREAEEAQADRRRAEEVWTEVKEARGELDRLQGQLQQQEHQLQVKRRLFEEERLRFAKERRQGQNPSYLLNSTSRCTPPVHNGDVATNRVKREMTLLRREIENLTAEREESRSALRNQSQFLLGRIASSPMAVWPRVARDLGHWDNAIRLSFPSPFPVPAPAPATLPSSPGSLLQTPQTA